MEQHRVKVLSFDKLTHDVVRIVTEKPEGYTFKPGQATEVAINKPGLEDQGRPFTFTSLNEDRNLEFTIKTYPEHDGMTDEVANLKVGDVLFISDVFGAIEYKGPGYFIAGGAGITPFIAIFRQLKKDGKLDGNKLFFSNKTAADVILEDELREMLGENAYFTLTRENKEGYEHGHIDEAYLKSHVDDFSKNFYVCGTPEMTEKINKKLEELGAKTESLVFEG